jgi:alpha-L-fucosidase
MPLTGALLAGRGQAKRVNAANLAWWREARFGLFIHWGLYAVPAGRWKGKDVPGIGEWIMHRRKIPVRVYEKLARRFNPSGFDAEAWVRLAREAGMRYIVITAKHHEGFAMFRSPSSPFNIVDATPWKRDPIAELAVACRRHQIPLCFYYSQDQDWHEPDGAWNDWDFDESKKVFTRYLEEKVKPQLTELLTQYGPIGLIWFDTPYTITRAHSASLKRLVHRLQPACLVSGRIGHDLGDYGSLGDNQIPLGRIEGDYETPATMNDTWGYKSRDRNWKSTRTLLYLLVDLASKGINYLLNVGPTARGEFPSPSIARLREIGAWMKANGESIHGTAASPFSYEMPWGRITQKRGRLYLHLFDWPRGVLSIHGLDSKVSGAFLLFDPKRRLAVSQRRDAAAGFSVLTLSGFGKKPGPHVSVVVLEISETARVETVPVQQPDGSVFLPSFMAERRGPRKGGFGVSRAGFTENWRSTAHVLSWTAKVLHPGTYRVDVLSSGASEHLVPARGAPHRLRVSLSAPSRARLTFSLVRNEDVSSPRAQYFPEILTHAGEIVLSAAGTVQVDLRAEKVSSSAAEGISVSGVRLKLVRSRSGRFLRGPQLRGTISAAGAIAHHAEFRYPRLDHEDRCRPPSTGGN